MTQGKPFIRPEDAQSMLREATPGPWQARGDGPSAGHPHFYICTCEDRAHVAENVYYRNARLLTYAPDLAEVVANLRYEYAVQVEMSDGEWHFTDDEFYPFGTPEPRHAEWQTKTGAEELYDSFVEDDGPKHIRIVRRLVSESEVVE